MDKMKSTQEEIQSLSERYLVNTYNRSLVFRSGEGSWLYPSEGSKYLDLTMGIGVCNLGHCHPWVSIAIARQAWRLMHCSNLFFNELQPQLAKVISEASFGGKLFFCNSGAEANEGLIKFARRWGSQHGGRYEIICAEHCFHGRTLGTLAATAKPKYREGFQPDVQGFSFAEFNNLESFRAKITDKTVAILVEPVQGEGGVWPARPEFLQGLRRLCDENSLLLLCDEVQCGMGRTGRMFAYQHYGIEPDAMSMAKALGNGVPMGAFELRQEHAGVFAPGLHGTTFGGTPLACAASLAVFEAFDKEKALDNCTAMGAYFKEQLLALQERHPECVADVRGLGLMLGFSAGKFQKPIQAACEERHLLVLTAGEDAIRLLPSLLITKEEIDLAVSILDEAMTAVVAQAAQ